MTGGPLRKAALAALVGVAASSAQGQSLERDTTITGPRGNSVNRQIQIQRGPGYVDRNIKITRPGGATFDRNTIIRGPLAGGGGRVVSGGFGGPRIIENNYFVRGGGGPGWGTALGIGGGLFGLGLLAGNAMSAPPPPPAVIYAPGPPVYVVPGPGVPPPPPGYAPPVANPPIQQVVSDPTAEAIARLSSHHDNSRREGCYTLGRLGDPRALNGLIDRLKNDANKDVRVAAAWALGEIGDTRAGVYLERAATYDKKREVRDAATRAFGRLPRAGSSPAPTAPRSAPRTTTAPALPPGEPDLLPLPESSNTPPPLPAGSGPPPTPRPPTGFDSRQ
jgi:hypothetical protein